MNRLNKKLIITICAVVAIIIIAVVFLYKGCKKTTLPSAPAKSAVDTDNREAGTDVPLEGNTDDEAPSDENTPSTQPVESVLAEDNTYNRIIKDKFKNFDGELSYSLHIYNSGYRACNESKPMKSASVIKLYIMEYAYSLMSKEEISNDTLINGTPLSSHLEAMITVSDNNATNVLIDYFTMDKLNEYFASCGYTNTKLQRRMLDTAAAARGEENYTCAQDVMKFLDKLYENKETYPHKDMLNIMKRQQIATKLRRDMPPGVAMASKTGELNDTENDVAIVFSPGGDYAIVCLTGNGSSYEARNAMATACRAIYDKLQQNIIP